MSSSLDANNLDRGFQQQEGYFPTSSMKQYHQERNFVGDTSDQLLPLLSSSSSNSSLPAFYQLPQPPLSSDGHAVVGFGGLNSDGLHSGPDGGVFALVGRSISPSNIFHPQIPSSSSSSSSSSSTGIELKIPSVIDHQPQMQHRHQNHFAYSILPAYQGGGAAALRPMPPLSRDHSGPNSNVEIEPTGFPVGETSSLLLHHQQPPPPLTNLLTSAIVNDNNEVVSI